MKLQFILAGMLFGIPAAVFAQSAGEVMSFTRSSTFGSARSVAMGNATTAVGADVFNAAQNPAGLGLFRKSTITLTPSIDFIGAKTNYLGQTERGSRGNFGLDQIGFAVNNRLRASISGASGWKSLTYGFFYTKTNSFQSNVRVQTGNSKNSLLDYFTADANSYGLNKLDPLGSQLAYDSYLLFQNPNGLFLNDTYGNGQMQQSISREIRGSQSEYNISLGANYNDKLYLGASIGLPVFRYENTEVTQERDAANNYYPTKDFTYTRTITDRGTGINGRFGAIFAPVPLFRIGLSLLTPTFYSVSDQAQATLVANYDTAIVQGQSSFSAASQLNQFNYKLTNPFKATLGLVKLFKENALLSADLDYLDYSTTAMRAKGYADFAGNINDSIAHLYGPAFNLRLGGEYRVGSMAFRAGYAHYGSPFNSNLDNMGGPQAIQSISMGIGMREQSGGFLDITLVDEWQKAFTYPYRISNESNYGYTTTQNRIRLLIGMGVRF